jgi:HAD superfamily hydrolase (TIGR01450 family)
MGLHDLRGFAFDLDGCIWAGATLLPGAAEMVAALRQADRRVVFVTNSSRERAASIAARLTRHGIETPPEDVLAALDLLGEAIRRRHGPVGVLALGTTELHEVLEAAGHHVVSMKAWSEAQAVGVGNDPAFDFDRLRSASRAVAAGAGFFTVNLDPRLPVAPDEWDPGCGAIAEAIAVAGGARPVVIGKPHRPIFEMALERLRCQPGEAAMVGDSLATDIAGGRTAGMATVWVDESGSGDGRGEATVTVRGMLELRRVWSEGGARVTTKPTP